MVIVIVATVEVEVGVGELLLIRSVVLVRYGHDNDDEDGHEEHLLRRSTLFTCAVFNEARHQGGTTVLREGKATQRREIGEPRLALAHIRPQDRSRSRRKKPTCYWLEEH